MPSVLQQHGFPRGTRTVRVDASSDSNPQLVVRVQKASGSISAIVRERLSVVVSSRASGSPLLLRPRDTVTLFFDESSVLMSVLGVYPLPVLCRRTGIIDKDVLLLSVA